MRIKVENGVVAIITNIAVEDAIRKPIILKDEKNNDIFVVAYDPEHARITSTQFVGNGVVDGKLAHIDTMFPGETIEDIRAEYEDIFAGVASCVAAVEAQLQASKDAFEAAWAGAIEA